MKNKTVIKIRSRINGSVKLEIKSEKQISKVKIAVIKDGRFSIADGNVTYRSLLKVFAQANSRNPRACF